MYNSFAARVSGTSLFIDTKYARLKQRLIKNKFPQGGLILINFIDHGTTLFYVMICLFDLFHEFSSKAREKKMRFTRTR